MAVLSTWLAEAAAPWPAAKAEPKLHAAQELPAAAMQHLYSCVQAGPPSSAASCMGRCLPFGSSPLTLWAHPQPPFILKDGRKGPGGPPDVGQVPMPQQRPGARQGPCVIQIRACRGPAGRPRSAPPQVPMRPRPSVTGRAQAPARALSRADLGMHSSRTPMTKGPPAWTVAAWQQPRANAAKGGQLHMPRSNHYLD